MSTQEIIKFGKGTIFRDEEIRGKVIKASLEKVFVEFWCQFTGNYEGTKLFTQEDLNKLMNDTCCIVETMVLHRPTPKPQTFATSDSTAEWDTGLTDIEVGDKFSMDISGNEAVGTVTKIDGRQATMDYLYHVTWKWSNTAGATISRFLSYSTDKLSDMLRSGEMKFIGNSSSSDDAEWVSTGYSRINQGHYVDGTVQPYLTGHLYDKYPVGTVLELKTRGFSDKEKFFGVVAEENVNWSGFEYGKSLIVEPLEKVKLQSRRFETNGQYAVIYEVDILREVTIQEAEAAGLKQDDDGWVTEFPDTRTDDEVAADWVTTGNVAGPEGTAHLYEKYPEGTVLEFLTNEHQIGYPKRCFGVVVKEDESFDGITGKHLIVQPRLKLSNLRYIKTGQHAITKESDILFKVLAEAAVTNQDGVWEAPESTQEWDATREWK